jgi:hypothetical protein
MAEPADMILPMLREMRAELLARFERVEARVDAGFNTTNRRLDAMEKSLASFKQALTADSLLSKLVTGEFEERIETLERSIKRIEALEQKVQELEAQK